MSAIKEFLDTFQETMPHHLRAEARAEVYSHLEAVAQEYQKNGLARPEAEARAVEQFGSPQRIAQAWRQADGIVDWPDILMAALPILGITGVGWTLIGQFIPRLFYLLIFGLGAAVAWRRNWPTWWYAWLGWLFLALLVIPNQKTIFFIIFPLLITMIAIDHWQYATLMTLPFTTYLAFVTLIDRQQLVTTGWGPGNIYPGNIVWLETAFSILWIMILAASLRTARPGRRSIYLLAGLIGTQFIYVGAVLLMIILAKLFPAYFITTLTTQEIFFFKLPVGLLTIGLTLYPVLVWLIARWLRRGNPRSRLPA